MPTWKKKINEPIAPVTFTSRLREYVENIPDHLRYVDLSPYGQGTTPWTNYYVNMVHQPDTPI